MQLAIFPNGMRSENSYKTIIVTSSPLFLSHQRQHVFHIIITTTHACTKFTFEKLFIFTIKMKSLLPKERDENEKGKIKVMLH